MVFSKRSVCSKLFATMCVLLAAMPALAALDGTIIVRGSKQGTFKSSHVLEVNSAIVSPRDPQSGSREASGRATGRRQHNPIRILKEIDQTSPMYWKALSSNEALEEVTIQFNAHGKLPRALKLEHASITAIKRVQRAGGRGEDEEITFVYEQIEWTQSDGNKTAQDAWDAK